MRKWLRRLGIAVLVLGVAPGVALYSYGRFAEGARGPASQALHWPMMSRRSGGSSVRMY